MDYAFTANYPTAADIPDLIRAAKTDYRAALTLSALYQIGAGLVPIDLAKAKECLKPHIQKHVVCAAAHDIQLQLHMDSRIRFVVLGKRRAEDLIRQARNGGDPTVKVYAGLILSLDKIVKRNFAEAEQFLLLAAGFESRPSRITAETPWGNPFARWCLAMHFHGRMELGRATLHRYVLEEYEYLFHSLMDYSAKHRIGMAEHDMGWFYCLSNQSPTNRGKSPNECRDLAIQYYLRAARQGVPESGQELVAFIHEAQAKEKTGDVEDAFRIYGQLGGEMLLEAAQLYEDAVAADRAIIARECRAFLEDEAHTDFLAWDTRDQITKLIRSLEWVNAADIAPIVHIEQDEATQTAKEVIAFCEMSDFSEARRVLSQIQNEWGQLPQVICAALSDPRNHEGDLNAAEKITKIVIEWYPRSEFTLNGLARLYLARPRDGQEPITIVRDFHECAMALFRASLVPITGRLSHHVEGDRETREITADFFRHIEDLETPQEMTPEEKRTCSSLYVMLARLRFLQDGLHAEETVQDLMDLSYSHDPDNAEADYLDVALIICSGNWQEARKAAAHLESNDELNALCCIDGLERQQLYGRGVFTQTLEDSEGKVIASAMVETSEALLKRVYYSLGLPLRLRLETKMQDLGMIEAAP